MKTALLSIVFMGAAVAPPVASGQQPTPPVPSVSTVGSAQIRVVPDLADLYFDVEIRNADLALARTQQTERATKVLEALRAAGVVEAELQSSPVQITPNYTDSEGRQETAKIKFYSVSQSISCTLHDLKNIPEVTAKAMASGATGVRDVSLRTSELRKYRDEARAKAVQAAKEKAVALATELGAKVGKPYSISETSAPEWRAGKGVNIVFGVDRDQPGDGTTPAFAPGTISINANVAVSFVLE